MILLFIFNKFKMCIICSEEYNNNEIKTSISTLVCCEKVETLPLNLHTIKKLDISKNRKIKTIPKEYSSLVELRLDCSNVEILETYPKLQKLSLSKTKIKSLPYGMTRMIGLRISETKISEIPKDMQELTHIQCQQSEISDLRDFHKLEFICCYLTNITEIKNLNLKFLDCSRCQIEDLPVLERLTYLNIDNTLIKQIKSYPRLTTLSMQYTNIERLSFLPSLAILDASFSKIKQIKIDDCPSITELTLTGSEITNIEHFPMIEVLRIQDTKISLLPRLGSLFHLAISGSFLKTLPRLVNLSELYLENSEIVNLGHLISLEMLDIKNCPYLLDIPIVDILNMENCPWVYPSDLQLYRLSYLQKIIKSYLQKRRINYKMVLNRKLPYELTDMVCSFLEKF